MQKTPICCHAVLFSSLLIAGVAQGDTYLVDVSSDDATLYTDPHTGNQIKIGGFSGICPVPGDATGSLFHVVTDRGPCGDYGDDGKFFAVPTYSPMILTMELLSDGTAEIIDVLPLRKPNGDPVVGVVDRCLPDDYPMVDLFQNDLEADRDPDALDPEGIAVDSAGNFWICDEYRPSICMLSPDGKVMLRLVPQGSSCGGEVIPTFEVLPGIFSRLQSNKALEGITITRSSILYATMQRPLENPDKETSESSRNIRVLRIDLKHLLEKGTAPAIQQLVYLTEENNKQNKVYASSLFSLTPSILLVAERRTDNVYALNVAQASDISALEDARGYLLADPARTIEQLSPQELSALGIRPIRKLQILAGTSDLDPALEKVEGIAVVGKTLVLCPDNDFNIDETSMDFNLVPAGLALQDPPNLPRVVTTPLPQFEFPED